MLKNRRLGLIILVILESLFCIGLGLFFYTKFQHQKLLDRAKLVTKINSQTTTASSAGKFKYLLFSLPDTIDIQSPDWLEKPSRHTINHDGLNERFNYPVDKPAGSFRILILGDSFTFGDFVSTPENWTELLEDDLNKAAQKLCQQTQVEVINFSMSGYDVADNGERYRQAGEKYQPDLILWFESGTGFYRINERIQPLIAACENATVFKFPAGSNEALAADVKCWDQANAAVIKQLTPAGIEAEIGNSYHEFFKLVPTQPVYIYAYKNYSEENQVTMDKYLAGHANAKYLPVVPMMTSKVSLKDGHPSPEGHKIIEATILKDLFQRQKDFCPALKK